MDPEDPNGQDVLDETPTPPKKRLTDTPAGQSIYVGLWILGTLATIAALIGAYYLGSFIATMNEEPPAEVVVEAEPVVEFPTLSGGPVSVGVWPWDELRGGECVTGYAGAFAEIYQVVGCEVPHDAQLVKARLLSDDPAAPFPGEDAIYAGASELCEVVDVLNLYIAGLYDDLVVEFSFPVTVEQWETGQRVVYCFVARSSGERLQHNLLR
jgi:hypothetical protein